MLKILNKYVAGQVARVPQRKPWRLLKPMLLSGGAVAIACISAHSIAETTIYSYDELGRVTAAEYENVSVSYLYDAADNRTKKQSVAIVPTPITSSKSTVLVHASTGAVLTVNVAGTSPSGTVSFYDGTTFLGSAAVIGNTATIEVIGLSLGLHTITATYSSWHGLGADHRCGICCRGGGTRQLARSRRELAAATSCLQRRESRDVGRGSELELSRNWIDADQAAAR